MLNNLKILKSIKYAQRLRLTKQANSYKSALSKLASPYLFKKADSDNDLGVKHKVDHKNEKSTEMKRLKPGVYEFNSGIFPLPGFGALGVSDFLRHAVAVTVHDKKPDVPGAYQLPNGQWVTYFSSNPTDKNPLIGGDNVVVWNGRWGKDKEHTANEFIFNHVVDPTYKIPYKLFGKIPVNWDPNELRVDYTRIADGEDEASRVAKIWQDLYKRNKKSFGHYNYGIMDPANTCLNAAAFALANSNLDKNNYPDKLGGGGSIPKEDIDKYINFGLTEKNKIPDNPAPTPLAEKLLGKQLFEAIKAMAAKKKQSQPIIG